MPRLVGRGIFCFVHFTKLTITSRPGFGIFILFGWLGLGGFRRFLGVDREKDGRSEVQRLITDGTDLMDKGG